MCMYVASMMDSKVLPAQGDGLNQGTTTLGKGGGALE